MSNPMDDQLERLFRERLGDYEAEPPTNALPEILGQVNQPSGWRISYRNAAVVTGILLLLSSSWFVWNEQTPENIANANKPKEGSSMQTHVPETPLAKPLTQNLIAKAKTTPLPQTTDGIKTKPQLPERETAISKKLPEAVKEPSVSLDQNNSASNAAKSTINALKSGISEVQKTEKLAIKTPVRKEKNTVQVEQKLPSETSVPGVNNAKDASKKVKPQAIVELEHKTEKIEQSPLSENTERELVQANKKQNSVTPKSVSAARNQRNNKMTDTVEPAQSTTQVELNNEAIVALQPTPSLISPQQISINYLKNRALSSAQNVWLLPLVEKVATPPTPIQPVRRGVSNVYLSIMPLYTYFSIRAQNTQNRYVENIKTAGSLSSQRIGWLLQSGFEKPLSERIYWRIGLSLAQQSRQLSYHLRTSDIDSVSVSRLDTQSVTLTPVYRREFVRSNQPWHFAGVRTSMMYLLHRGSTEHFLVFGGEAGAKISGKASFNAFLNVGYGLSQPLGDGITLRVEPTLNYALTSHIDEAQHLKLRPYTVGINFGLVWKMN